MNSGNRWSFTVEIPAPAITVTDVARRDWLEDLERLLPVSPSCSEDDLITAMSSGELLERDRRLEQVETRIAAQRRAVAGAIRKRLQATIEKEA